MLLSGWMKLHNSTPQVNNRTKFEIPPPQECCHLASTRKKKKTALNFTYKQTKKKTGCAGRITVISAESGISKKDKS